MLRVASISMMSKPGSEHPLRSWPSHTLVQPYSARATHTNCKFVCYVSCEFVLNTRLSLAWSALKRVEGRGQVSIAGRAQLGTARLVVVLERARRLHCMQRGLAGHECQQRRRYVRFDLAMWRSGGIGYLRSGLMTRKAKPNGQAGSGGTRSDLLHGDVGTFNDDVFESTTSQFRERQWKFQPAVEDMVLGSARRVGSRRRRRLRTLALPRLVHHKL